MEEFSKVFEDRVEKLYGDFSCKVDGELSRRNRLRTDMEVRFNDLNSHFKEFHDQEQKLEQMVKRIMKTMGVISEFATIQTSLNLQDEHDRDFVSLFGALEANPSASRMQVKSSLAKDFQQPEKRSRFTINQDCMSCSGSN